MPVYVLRFVCPTNQWQNYEKWNFTVIYFLPRKIKDYTIYQQPTFYIKNFRISKQTIFYFVFLTKIIMLIWTIARAKPLTIKNVSFSNNISDKTLHHSSVRIFQWKHRYSSRKPMNKNIGFSIINSHSWFCIFKIFLLFKFYCNLI